MPTTSPKYSVNLKDAIEAALYAALVSPFLVILTSFSAGKFDINWTAEWQMAVSNLAGYLIKKYFSGPKPPQNGTGDLNNKMMPMVFVLVLLSGMCTAQSIWKPLPIPQRPMMPNRFFRTTLPTDSLPSLSLGKFQGFRFSGPDLAFAFPDFSAYTGVGIDYVWAVANNPTSKWDYQYTIGGRVYGGANLGSPTIRTLGAVGLRATFFKGWLALGALYNLTMKKTQGTIGNPAALIPPLN